MIVAKVVGPVVSTEKNSSLHAKKLLLVEPEEGNDTSLIAVDCVQAGPGDKVLICREGSGSRQLLGDSKAPVNANHYWNY